MSEVIARVNSEFKNVLRSRTNIFNNMIFNNLQVIDYTPSHKLEDDELFQLVNFSKSPYYIPECNSSYSTASLSQILDRDYTKINCIIIKQGQKKHFQKVTNSLFVNGKKFLGISGEPKITECNNQIELKSESDATYCTENDVLYFRDLSKIKSIFPNIGDLHREATQAEVDLFLNNDFIELSNFSTQKVGVVNRKRIADVGQKFSLLTEDKKDKLIEYAKENADVEIDSGNFVISKDNELKKLLYAMDQRYYYADIYEENRVASSVRVV